MRIRYRYIERTILDLYNSISPSLLHFPLNVIEIIKQLDNCKLWSYQYYAKHHNISVDDVIKLCESDSGCTIYNPHSRQYLILFNKSTCNYNVEGRQNFTLAHEMGHIKLKHLINIQNNMAAENNFNKPTPLNSIYEKEADHFSTTFLAPLPLFKMFNIKSPIDVQNIFGLSVMASGYRFKDYIKWSEHHVKTSWENEIVNLFN